jgi:hypothetical protein
MPKIISLPVVDLIAADMPAEVRDLLDAYNKARAVTGGLHGEVSRLPMHDGRYAETNQRYEASLADLQAAHAALAEGTRRSPRQIQDSTAGSFGAHVDRARALLVEAEGEMRSAAAAAAMFATAKRRAGQPILSPGENTIRTYGPRVRAMSVVSQLRDLQSQLPEDVDD